MEERQSEEVDLKFLLFSASLTIRATCAILWIVPARVLPSCFDRRHFCQRVSREGPCHVKARTRLVAAAASAMGHVVSQPAAIVVAMARRRGHKDRVWSAHGPD